MTLRHPGTLAGRLVTLEPLAMEHHDGLVAATEDGEMWRLTYTRIPSPDEMRDEIRRRLRLQDEGGMLAFTARRTDTGAIIGMTTFMNIDASVPRVEIGSTWNAESSHGTGTNPESKLLLLRHAFEVWECSAVEFRTDFFNRPSREAIERLGAKQDGILRAHTRLPAGYVRDTVVFSITRAEWPGVRVGLEARVLRHVEAASPDSGSPRLG
ncbi:GNAT family N-acetyltransferase [Leucobacter sp. CSA1]|uniref:GNAT family N-acetyltransferase n=1 Tax=Leucobacter chromiisoli TaxID=2796471 RepID=A0A934Q5Q5_9MICO|nr:GNAT family protein [Leucobacter chromiisoli]MBK0417541.1 GNAT family N-acetyltransferase [Leucobacter chromiisoli]